MRKVVWLLALAACGDDGGSTGGDGGVPANAGYIGVSTYNAMGATTPIMGGGVNVQFNVNAASACTDAVVDSCDVLVCTGLPAPQTFASAGTVTILGLTQPVTMAPMVDKTYTVYSAQQALFAGGETINISAPGADAPAFTIAVTAPTRATITSPAKPAAGGLTIDRTQDFTATWTGGGVGKVYLYVSGPSGSNATIACGFAASAGTGSVPAAALAMLPAGMGAFTSTTISVKTVDKNDWRIYGQAFFNSVWAADTTMATATATLQ
jgi:hypothetical protein